MAFWRNPEFVRHLRGQLRAPRALTALTVMLVVCVLVGLSSWSSHSDNRQEFFSTLYVTLVVIQYGVVGLWCASACGQAIARERELKTFDSLRTTRLSWTELVVGMILGRPVLAYFVVGCSMPISGLAGLLAGYPLGAILGTYVLLVLFALFVGLVGLWGSMLSEKASSAMATGLIGLLPIGAGLAFIASPFPGLGALSLVPALLSLHQEGSQGIVPTFFGSPTNFLSLTLLLYVAFGAWFVVMLSRNLKKDLEEIRLLSRRQAIGFAAFLNVLFYAFLDLKQASSGVFSLAVALNVLILYMVGFSTLTPHERLKVWWRRRAAGQSSYLAEDGLPWPWLVLAALTGYALMAAAALFLGDALGPEQRKLGTAGIQLLTFLAFITRDMLFLQWCRSTGMKTPVFSGVAYLLGFYVAAGILSGLASQSSSWLGALVLNLLTPFGVLSQAGVGVSLSPGWYLGVGLQLLVIVVLLLSFSRRLQSPAIIPATTMS